MHNITCSNAIEAATYLPQPKKELRAYQGVSKLRFFLLASTEFHASLEASTSHLSVTARPKSRERVAQDEHEIRKFSIPTDTALPVKIRCCLHGSSITVLVNSGSRLPRRIRRDVNTFRE